MPEPAISAWLLLSAVLASVAGMGWLALSMQVHAQQVWGSALTVASPRLLRTLGAFALALSLWLCLRVDHASMAVLVWVMTLATTGILVAFILTWRASWLRLLAPWLRATSTAGGGR
jgi:hypothetical protein